MWSYQMQSRLDERAATVWRRREEAAMACVILRSSLLTQVKTEDQRKLP